MLAELAAAVEALGDPALTAALTSPAVDRYCRLVVWSAGVPDDAGAYRRLTDAALDAAFGDRADAVRARLDSP